MARSRTNRVPPVFIDTSYPFASINTRDQRRVPAVRWRARVVASGALSVTTQLVLVEFADGFSGTPFRRRAADAIAALHESDVVEIIPVADLFDDAFALYPARPDKEWSLTDCASFVAMQRRGLRAAQTSDHHFRQAGFVPRLLDNPAP